MSIKEKVAYLTGLAEGLGLDAESKEGKLISVIIDTLSDVADELDILGENAIDMGEEIEAISDNLAGVEEFLFKNDYGADDYDDFNFDDDDCGEDHDGCGCGHCQADDDFVCEAECPACGEEIEIAESDLLLGSAACPACGKELEFEFDDEEGIDDGEKSESE